MPLKSHLRAASLRAAIMISMTSASLVASPSRAQETAMRDNTMLRILSGREMPLSVPVKDLDASFRRFVVDGAPGVNNVQNMWIEAKAGVELGVYLTRGATVKLGDETYLVAYRPSIRLNPEIFRGHGNNNDVVQMRKMGPNSKLTLSLLNLRTTSSLNDIRPFDRARDVETAAEGIAASVRSLQRLGAGIRTWTYSRGGVFPEMKAITPAFKRVFYPHVHDQRLWENPTSEELVRPNAALSGLRFRDIINVKYVFSFAENSVATDGMRGVLFLDGHVERVDAARWERLKKVAPLLRAGVKKPVVKTTVVTSVEGDGTTTIVVPAQ